MVLATNSKSRQEPEVWEWTWDPFDEKRYLLGWDEKRKKKKKSGDGIAMHGNIIQRIHGREQHRLKQKN